MKYLLQQLRLCSTLWPGGCISCNQCIVQVQNASAYFRLKKYLIEGPDCGNLHISKNESPLRLCALPWPQKFMKLRLIALLFLQEVCRGLHWPFFGDSVLSAYSNMVLGRAARVGDTLSAGH